VQKQANIYARTIRFTAVLFEGYSIKYLVNEGAGGTLRPSLIVSPQPIPQLNTSNGAASTGEHGTGIDDVLRLWQPGVFRELWIEISDERSKRRVEGSATASYFAQAEVLVPSKKLLARGKLLGEGAFGTVFEVQERWSQDSFAMKLVKPVSASSV